MALPAILGLLTMGGLGALSSGLNYASQQNTNNAQMAFNREEAEKDRLFQEKQAQIARDWQSDMSNTELLRTANQLRQLGINPTAYFANGGRSVGMPVASGQTAGASASTSLFSPRIDFQSVIGSALSVGVALGLTTRSRPRIGF